jgi:hypothetical protein
MALIPTNYVTEGSKLTEYRHKFSTEIEKFLFYGGCFPSDYKHNDKELKKNCNFHEKLVHAKGVQHDVLLILNLQVTELRDGQPGFDSQYGQGCILFHTPFKPAFESRYWVPGFFCAELEQSGREPDRLPLCSDRLRMVEAIPPLSRRLHNKVLN